MVNVGVVVRAADAEACNLEQLQLQQELAGAIVLADRGTCMFIEKVGACISLTAEQTKNIIADPPEHSSDCDRWILGLVLTHLSS